MTQFTQAADGARIAFEIVGRGEPILLVHGFASDRVQNWRAPGWYDTLTGAGCQVIAMDCRGRGESEKFYDPACYGREAMSGDILSVIAAAGLGPVYLMGYSMGGMIGIHLLAERPDVVRKLVVGGVGGSYLKGGSIGSRTAIADALLAPDKNALTDPTAKAFREFAGQPGKDIRALAACMRAERKTLDAVALSRCARPVLVVCGENDLLTGSPEPLAAALPGGRAVTVPNRDHMTTVGDKAYRKAVLDFLKS